MTTSSVSIEAVDLLVQRPTPPSVRSVLDVALLLHGVLAVIYGAAALTHPAILEPFHRQPSEEHAHFFHLNGIALLTVGLVALYVATMVRDRVHTFWVALALWLYTISTFYASYTELVQHAERVEVLATASSVATTVLLAPHSTWNLVRLQGALSLLYAAAFAVVTCLPYAPVVDGSHHHHSGHAERVERARDKKGL